MIEPTLWIGHPFAFDAAVRGAEADDAFTINVARVSTNAPIELAWTGPADPDGWLRVRFSGADTQQLQQATYRGELTLRRRAMSGILVNTPPAGMINRVNRGSGTAALAIHDTAGAASSFAGHTVAGTIRSSYRSIVFELKAAAAAKRFLVGAIPLSEKYVGADKNGRYVGTSLEWTA